MKQETKNPVYAATVVIACAAFLYLALYAGARMTHVLVMYDGYRGTAGVQVADLGPVPKETVILCALSRTVFWPLMQIETVVRAQTTCIY